MPIEKSKNKCYNNCVKTSTLIKFIDKKIVPDLYGEGEGSKFFVFFDRFENPYMAALTELTITDTRDKAGISCDDDAFSINVFNMEKKLIAKAIFAISDSMYGRRSYDRITVYLARIEIFDKADTQKGIARNMLKMIELFAMNHKKKEICAYMVPFSFAKGDTDGVGKFYEKMGFSSKSTLAPDNDLYSIYKYLQPQQNVKLKLSVMDYPATNRNYTILFPARRIVSSHYKGMENELSDENK